ncbi:cell division protein ZapA [Permianibacter aggregans]|uniref:Cell division protein ZapA n=1 Tax=Permianibacter aggregans TaxID=1510150 RepID=A0A4R6UGY0_9GAMM|nr:cell division protein ZapA [Permianibacter aggregans]QGX40297.1 cell division protein ZapA [Permianibacter aggregans]TDQ44215.1 cell division protein ZapA [Permianibacter aggregans]
MKQLTIRLLDREMKVAVPEDQSDSLLQAARNLDARLRELRDGNKVAGLERIALLVALDLSHELLLQQGGQVQNAELSHRLQRMQEKIDATLASNRQLELN